MNCFGAIVDKLDLHHWQDETCSPPNTSDKINDIIKNYEKHSRICDIKTKYGKVIVICYLSQFLSRKSKKSFEILILTKSPVVKHRLSY